MYISMNWIKDFVDLDGLNDEELINKFTLSTAEVEGITKYGENTKGVVVGKVLSVENVENSNKLHIVKVDIGEKTIQSVCGAPNVAVGQTIAFAPEGSMVGGINIKASTLNGIPSNGVCLSEKELGVGDDHSGIMILEDTYKAGTDLKEIFPIDDTVFEVDNKSLTNRPDLWGHYGIAREFAALTGRNLKDLDIQDLEAYSSLKPVDIKVESDKCLRYSGIEVENITKKHATKEMKTRLYYCGSRSINLLADITNYIMMELGQPMHAFDKSLVSNIVVKMLDKETEFVTLDGNTRKIDTNTLMICDSEKPIAIAGIMGGENTEIKASTNSLLLESATFDTVTIRKATTRLGLRTDASTRYEKTLDPELTPIAIKRYIKLLKDVDQDIKVVSSLTDVYTKKYDTITIEIDEEYISKRIGQTVDSDTIESILKSLCFGVERNGSNFKITVPSYRATKDITNKADIVEEIARIYGYDKIIARTTLSPLLPVKQDETREMEYEIKKLLAEKYGMSEVHSYVWYDTKLNNELNIETENNIRIINSLNAENSTLRYSMIPTLLNMVYNNLKNYDTVNIFEIGRVFNYKFDGSDVIENKVLGIALSKINSSDKDILFELKKAVNAICKINKNIDVKYVDNTNVKHNWVHPVNSFVISVDNVEIGYISILHPNVKIHKKASIAVCEIYIEKLAQVTKIDKVYKKFTKFQTVDIDLSLIVDNTTLYKTIENIISSTNLEYMLGYKLIDIYEDKEKLGDKKSVTLRFTLGSYDKTLTSEEINSCLDNLITTFESNNIEIRK